MNFIEFNLQIGIIASLFFIGGIGCGLWLSKINLRSNKQPFRHGVNHE